MWGLGSGSRVADRASVVLDQGHEMETGLLCGVLDQRHEFEKGLQCWLLDQGHELEIGLQRGSGRTIKTGPSFFLLSVRCSLSLSLSPVSYTHLTLPTTGDV